METIKFGTLKEQSHTMQESLRALRTNIQFCGDDVKTILFTSALPNEGKSTTVINLARSFEGAGKRVLVIDTDMRKSVLVGRLKAKNLNGGAIHGLSHFLSGQTSTDDVIYATTLPRMFMVFAGPSVPNPTEMLERKRMGELVSFGRRLFDYILIDCAPLGAAIDAAVVAKHCDGAVIVVAQGDVGSRMILDAKKQLEASGVRILGGILNKVQMDKSRYYGKYYGKYYGNYYGHYYGNDTQYGIPVDSGADTKRKRQKKGGAAKQ